MTNFFARINRFVDINGELGPAAVSDALPEALLADISFGSLQGFEDFPPQERFLPGQ